MLHEYTDASSRIDGLTLIAIRNSLQQVGTELERMWAEAVIDNRSDTIHLADATQAIHRALVALDEAD